MATETSCISHPPRQRLVVVREDYLHLCEGNHCAAALLNFFEHGHNYKVGNQKDAIHANEVAEKHGDPGTQSTSLLQYHNEESLEDGLLGLYNRRRTIRPALELLASKGFISIHRNPNPRYYFDKTRYILFHPEIVQPQVLDLFDQDKSPHRQGQKSSPSGQKSSRRGLLSSTRTEITPQITDLEIPPCLPTEDIPPLTPETLVELYNTETPEGHPKVTKLTVERRKKAKLYLRQFPDPDFWHTVCAEIVQSAFLQGLRNTNGHQGFTGNFDWLLMTGRDHIENCVKVAEARYRDQASTKPSAATIWEWAKDIEAQHATE